MTKLRDVTKAKPHDYDTHMYVSLSVHRARKHEGEAPGQCERVSGHVEETHDGDLQAASRTTIVLTNLPLACRPEDFLQPTCKLKFRAFS